MITWLVKKIVAKFTFHPHQKVIVPIESLPDHVSERWIPTKDGESLQALYYKHYDHDKHPLVIYFHGNTGNLFSHNRPEFAEKLYQLQQNVLLVSYRGYSGSTGYPSEKGLYLDGVAAIKFAKNVLGFETSQITILGRSLGTVVAIHVSQKRNFKGLILITPLSNGADMAKVLGFKWLSFLAKTVFKSDKKIKKVPCKKLIIAADKDLQTPFYMAEKLYEAAKPPKKLVLIKNGGHNNLQFVDSTLFWKEIETFLNED
jgi:hypothetical protein